MSIRTVKIQLLVCLSPATAVAFSENFHRTRNFSRFSSLSTIFSITSSHSRMVPYSISLGLSTLFVHLLAATANFTDFQNDALARHNILRQQHCVPSLVLNSSLNAIAQNFATYLAVNNFFNHSRVSGLGENLWAVRSTGTLGNINGKIFLINSLILHGHNHLFFFIGSRAVNDWYSEYAYYNYSAPGYATYTAHFTQIVWKSSTQLGVGIAYNGNRSRAVVVANYLPAGNVQGNFPINVFPLCNRNETTNTTKTTSTTTRTTTSTTTTTRAPNTTVSRTTTRASNTTASLSTSRSSTTGTTTRSPINLANFQNEALQQHNFRRQQHCVPLMVLNSTLINIAQNHANYLAANSLAVSSNTPGVGESVWGTYSTSGLPLINGNSNLFITQSTTTDVPLF